MDAVIGSVIEGGTIYLLARVQGADGVAIVQADLTGIALEVWKCNPPAAKQLGSWTNRYIATETPEQFGTTATVTVADVVFDALQTDARWTLDETGYNFRLALGPTAFDVIAIDDDPKSQWYRATVKFDPADPDETDFKAVFWIEVQSDLFGKG